MSFFNKFTAQAVASSIVLVSAPSDKTLAVVSHPIVANNISETPTHASVEPTTMDAPVLIRRVAPDEWTKSLERKFRKLAATEAMGKNSSEDSRELKNLIEWRRELNNPRSEEDVLWTHKQEAITAKLIEALQQYVQFHEVASRSEGKSKAF